MSVSSDFSQVRSIRLGNNDDLMKISDAGTYTSKSDDGVTLSVTIDQGKMVDHSAQDETGNSLQTFLMKISTNSPEGAVCYVCYTGGDYNQNPYCHKIPCSI